MKNKIILLIGLAAIVSLIFYAFMAAGPEARPGARAPEVSTLSSKVPEPVKSAVAPVASFAGTPALSDQPALESASRQTIMEAIQTASVSYDPVELPRIQPFLSHPDPEVRAAALNGIVVLGHAAGAPLLREAARSAATTKEAVELLTKADYLELPSAPVSMRSRFKKAGKRAAPAPK